MLYLMARTLIAFLQALPLRAVARLGRAAGSLAYYSDARHRRVALRNLGMCFGRERTPVEIRVMAREHFRRLGENYGCAIKTTAMSSEQLRPHFELAGTEKLLSQAANQIPQSRVVAIGHFGNFELYARIGQYLPEFQCATTYRALRQPSLNRLMQSLRERSGCRFFERRTEAAELKTCMARPGLLLGLLADQRSAHAAVRLPFLGHECLTSAAPAVFALRYRCPLHTAICYRIGLARWRIDFGDEIPTRDDGRPRSTLKIMLEVNRAFEVAVRRDPANWFWVHDRWKLPKSKVRSPETGVHSPKSRVQDAETVS